MATVAPTITPTTEVASASSNAGIAPSVVTKEESSRHPLCRRAVVFTVISIAVGIAFLVTSCIVYSKKHTPNNHIAGTGVSFRPDGDGSLCRSNISSEDAVVVGGGEDTSTVILHEEADGIALTTPTMMCRPVQMYAPAAAGTSRVLDYPVVTTRDTVLKAVIANPNVLLDVTTSCSRKNDELEQEDDANSETIVTSCVGDHQHPNMVTWETKANVVYHVATRIPANFQWDYWLVITELDQVPDEQMGKVYTPNDPDGARL